MYELEIAQECLNCIIQKNSSQNDFEKLLEEDFLTLKLEQKSVYLYELLNGLMRCEIAPQIIVRLYNSLMKLDLYNRDNVTVASTKNDIVLECTGSGKKPNKTLNISTPSIITAVAAGAKIIKKGSGATSSIIGSADLMYELGFQEIESERSVVDMLNSTGFTFVNIEKVIPVFNSVYNGHFFKPHILSYILAANVTSLRGNKIVYGLSDVNVQKSCDCLNLSNKDCDITVYSSTDNGVDYYDELIGTGTCSVVRKKRNIASTFMTDYTLELASAKKVAAASTRTNSIDAVINALKYQDNLDYCEIICSNAGFYLLEAEIVEDIDEGKKMARDCLYSGKAYKKMCEIIEFSGGSLVCYGRN